MRKAGLFCFLFAFLVWAPLDSVFADSIATVRVPAGSLNPFWQKPAKNGKTKKIQIPALTVQVHQVTNGEFLKFLKASPEWSKKQISPLLAESNYLGQFNEDLNLVEGVDANAPVTSVSWFAARAYCQSLGFRLPTSIEWEYLAAASEKIKDANKEPAFLERILVWYGQPKSESIQPVKSVYKNLYGLHDMHGLVWEWVDDFNSSLVTGESREDSSLNRDLFCGAGNIASGDKENYAAFMRFAFRSSLKGKSSLWNLGFRCVKGKTR